MKKVNLKAIKTKSWYKPVSIAALCLAVVALVYGSISVTRYMTGSNEMTGEIYDSTTGGHGSSYFSLVGNEIDGLVTSTLTRDGLKVSMEEDELNGDGEVKVKEKLVGTDVIGNVSPSEMNDQSLGEATSLETMKYDITKSVLSEVENHYGEVIIGATGVKGEKGDTGEPGRNGLQGKTGATGPAGPAGKTGATGATGKTGATGAVGQAGKDGEDGHDGQDGKDGKDGNSIFVRYSANKNGAGMTEDVQADTKYMGTYVGSSASNSPQDYTWAPYQNAYISYDEGTNTLIISQ